MTAAPPPLRELGTDLAKRLDPYLERAGVRKIKFGF